MTTKAFRIIKRYTYSTELASGFPTLESANKFNRRHFLKDEVFGPEGRVEEYDGVPFRDTDGRFQNENGQWVE
jgi:hypothetical protein